MVNEDQRRYTTREFFQGRLKYATHIWKNKIPYDGLRRRGLWKKPKIKITLHRWHRPPKNPFDWSFLISIDPFYTTRFENEA